MRFPFLDDVYVEMRLLATERHRLSCEAVRFKNRLQGVLDLAWPEYLEHFSDLTHPTPVALLEKWPLPRDLCEAFSLHVRRIAKVASQNHYGAEKVDRLLATAHRSVGLVQGADVRRKEIVHLLERWALVRKQMQEVDIALTARVERCPAAKALTTIPEIGAVCAATIVAELGTPEDYESPRQVLKLAGMNLPARAPVWRTGSLAQGVRARPLRG